MLNLWLVSIPHRYGKNSVIATPIAVIVALFPFLIGTVRTHPWSRIILHLPRVSIPHRYGKNESS